MNLSEFTPLFAGYLVFLAALLGLICGSFLNCLAWRSVHGESIARGRSHCAQCGHVLSAGELIPLFSYLIQKGRCRHCKEKISPRYVIVEALCALVFVSILLRYGLSAYTPVYMILAFILLTLALIDLDSFTIPNGYIVAGIALFLLRCLIPGVSDLPQNLIRGLIGGLSVSLPVFIISLIADRVLKKESMGGGDIKLLFMTGLFFDWKASILNLIVACILGILGSGLLRRGDGSDAPKNAFPFGPAICASVWLGLLFAEQIINAYLGLF